MTILLTGGAGYIGSHVLFACLAAGHEVVVLDDFSNSSPAAVSRVRELAGGAVTLYRGDVRDGKLLADIFAGHAITSAMHFAGKKAVNESVADPLDYYGVNVGGGMSLMRAMAAAGVFRLVFSSTASVYGERVEMPLTETSPLGEPANPYGRSKMMVERVLTDLCRADARWSVGVLRYFNPAGAHPSGRIGEDPLGPPSNLIPYAAQVAVGRRPQLLVFGNDYPTSDGTGVRDYIHVMDLAQGHLAALGYLKERTGHHVWNLGTGRGYSVLEVIRGIERVTGQPLPWAVAPRRAGDIAQYWADPGLAGKDLGWRATRGLDDILADHLRWQQQNREGYAG